MEQGKYVPPVEHWKEHEYDLFHHKRTNNFSRKGDKRNNRNKNRRGRGNKNKDDKNKEAGGDVKPNQNKNESKSWNGIPGLLDTFYF